MNTRQNRRAQFRRYTDRRVAALLELHEILFFENSGVQRDEHLLDTINEDFQTDRVVIVQMDTAAKDSMRVLSATSNWAGEINGVTFQGAAIEKIVQTQSEFNGALTLSKFRSSSLFSPQQWLDLWSHELHRPASALLSVPICAPNVPPSFMWLIVDSGSREWSSHDRDLSEEESLLLARVLEKKMLVSC